MVNNGSDRDLCEAIGWPMASLIRNNIERAYSKKFRTAILLSLKK